MRSKNSESVKSGAVRIVEALDMSLFPSWEGVQKTFRSGNVPHCWAFVAPPSLHAAILDAVTRLYLCDSGIGSDRCGGCGGWSQGESGSAVHPDCKVIGEFDKAPNVAMCRDLITELALLPVAAKRRVGVVLAADGLLLSAANSLLKVAEEPPSHAALFFLLAENNFLPTLRSRSRFTTLAMPRSCSEKTGKHMPGNEAEWLSCLSEMKDDGDIPELLSAWTTQTVETGDWTLAERLEKLRLIILQRKLSYNMVCDLLILTLKEELPFEHISGGIR